MRTIYISEGGRGYSYATIFGSCLDGNVEWVELDDPYIRARHQLHNFVRFCELVVQGCQRLKRIHLTTGTGEGHNEVSHTHSVPNDMTGQRKLDEGTL